MSAPGAAGWLPLPRAVAFRRKSADLVEESVTTVTTDEESAARPRGYTPSKKELGQVTPKRPVAGRRPTAPAKPLTKEEARAQRRAARAEAAAEFRREGGPRDRGRSGCWPATWSTPGGRSAPGSSAVR
ncbi:hypothetical protein [Micromonospora sp. b486]|uniref:hypothetical protein n=1 Tax=Micromonospora sp. b486 TaxID=3053986 RepID=UPI00259D2CF4|nr:hypothetical protein [Micromonospora sp. b486]MDM4784610.1 hypothetical protein [Micromonospora sp. b486]